MSKYTEEQFKVYEELFDLFLKDAPQKDELKEVIFSFLRSEALNNLLDFLVKWGKDMFYPKPEGFKKFSKSTASQSEDQDVIETKE